MGKTSIEWTDYSWPVVNGCSRASAGCQNCYAERLAATRLRHHPRYAGLAEWHNGKPRWTGETRLAANELEKPLRWRKPRRIFVADMGDLFHRANSNETIAAVFGVMAATPWHTFQVLTKRAARMLAWFEWLGNVPATYATSRLYRSDLFDAVNVKALLGQEPASKISSDAVDCMKWAMHTLPREDRSDRFAMDLLAASVDTRCVRWPLPNVWLGVSAEDQATADERIPHLLACPAAVRWVSAEPLLGPVDLTAYLGRLDWAVVGGESGPGARPCSIGWIRDIVQQCGAASVRRFVKQLGGNPLGRGSDLQIRVSGRGSDEYRFPLELRDRKGGDVSEWPEDLRVREYPEAGL